MTISAEASDAPVASGVLPGEPGSFVHIRVSDTGSGMPPDVVDRIFDPLFTTKAAGGTGLGLTLAHQIVVGHGGAILAESIVHCGSTFHIFLPRAHAVETDAVAAPRAPERFSGRVLLVEDDEAVAAGIEAILSSEDIETTVVSRGADAIVAIAQSLPDAVVLDLSLPDMDGLVVYETIAQRWPRLPVIFSTGHGDSSRIGALATNPHIGFLMKPYEAQELIDELRIRTARLAPG